MEFSAAQLQYLEHLNVDVWVPRDLPVAESLPIAEVAQVSSPIEALQETVNDPRFEPSVQAQSDTAAVQLQSAVQSSAPSAVGSPIECTAAVVNTMGASNGTSAMTAPAFPQADPALSGSQSILPTTEQAPEFNIQFWCYSTGLWMVTDQVDLLPEHHKFVHNVAAFLQGKKRKPRHVGIFSWPMLDSPNIDQGPAVATKHLNDHIQRLTSVVPVKKIGAFGECEKWFADQPIVSSGLSLTSIFENPSFKKQLWQTLLPHQISE